MSQREIFNYRKIPVGVIIACIIGVVFFLLSTFALYAIPLELEWGRTIEQERMEHSCTHIFFAVFPALALLTFVLVQMSKVRFLHYILTHHFYSYFCSFLYLQLYALYAAVESGHCTDDFTAEIIMSRLYPTPQAGLVTFILYSMLLVTAVVS